MVLRLRGGAQTKQNPRVVVVIIMPIGETFKVPIEWHDTILDLKKEVEKMASVRVKNQRLMFDGRFLDSDKAKVGACGIRRGSKICLFPKNAPTNSRL